MNIELGVSDRPTDRRTDGGTDTAAYRDARTNLETDEKRKGREKGFHLRSREEIRRCWNTALYKRGRINVIYFQGNTDFNFHAKDIKWFSIKISRKFSMSLKFR